MNCFRTGSSGKTMAGAGGGCSRLLISSQEVLEQIHIEGESVQLLVIEWEPRCRGPMDSVSQRNKISSVCQQIFGQT